MLIFFTGAGASGSDFLCKGREDIARTLLVDRGVWAEGYVHEHEKTPCLEILVTCAFLNHVPKTIEVAAGDKLLLLANRKDEGFRATNGELITVRGVDRDGIHLDDGLSNPANYREFTHGYAVTAHRSQGKTVDSVIISADVMKQELFYVSASRGREDIARRDGSSDGRGSAR